VSLRFLLDTSTISRVQGPRPDTQIAERLAAVAGDAAVASVAFHELLYGVAILPVGRRRQNLERFIETAVTAAYVILPYDGAAAEWHARERARLQKLGRTPPFRDGQIAATAVVNGLTVVTANPRDFQAFDGLSIEDWSAAG